MIRRIERAAIDYFKSHAVDPSHGLIHPQFAERIRDHLPYLHEPIRGAESVIYLFGLPLRTDPTIPDDEIHFMNTESKVVGKIVGLSSTAPAQRIIAPHFPSHEGES